MRFRILPGKTVYKLDDIEQLTLLQHLQLARETAELGRTLDMASIEQMQREINACKDDEARKTHPDGPWLLAVCIWAARVTAGDDITFADAISFPIKNLEYLPEPQDHKKAADPTRARPGSGRARKRPAAARPATKTSKRASTAG